MQNLIVKHDINFDIEAWYLMRLKDLKRNIETKKILHKVKLENKNYFYQYYNLLNRVIPLKERKLIENPNMVVPKDIENGYEKLKFDIKIGNNLNKYQTDNIFYAYKNDLMLDRDDLFHFHLSTTIQTQEKYKGLVERTDFLAIAKVKNDEVIIIDIVKHIHENKGEANKNSLKGTDLTFCNMKYFEDIENFNPTIIANNKISKSLLKPKYYSHIKKTILRKNGYITFNTTKNNNMYFENDKKSAIGLAKIQLIREIELDIKEISKYFLSYKLENKEATIVFKYSEVKNKIENKYYVWIQHEIKILILITRGKTGITIQHQKIPTGKKKAVI